MFAKTLEGGCDLELDFFAVDVVSYYSVVAFLCSHVFVVLSVAFSLE